LEEQKKQQAMAYRRVPEDEDPSEAEPAEDEE